MAVEMYLSRSGRIALFGVILLAVLAILWSFFSRRQEKVELPPTGILPPQISRQSTKFEYVEHKRGRTVFKVNADTSTETVDRVHTLNDLEVIYYDEMGSPSDTISGRQAVYRMDQKQIQFSGETRIRLSDGTEVFSDRVQVDLLGETVSIEESFRLRQGEVQGQGQALTYQIPRREVNVARGLQLVIPAEKGNLQGGSRQATYRLRAQVIELRGEARITQSDAYLEAERMTLFLDEGQKIRKILSSGQAALQAGSSKFTGHQINVFWTPDSDYLQHFEVLGETSRSPAGKAHYTESMGEDFSSLEADRIVGTPSQSPVQGRLVLERLRAGGTVLFQSPALGIREARSDELEVEFGQRARQPRHLKLTGSVSVIRARTASESTVQEELHSSALLLRFEPGGELEHARADVNVNVRVKFPEGFRHLFARESLEVDYSAGVPERILARGGCRGESLVSDERRSIEGSMMEARYDNGVLGRVWVAGDVRIKSLEQGKTRSSASDRLEIFYREGSPEKAIESGHVVLQEGDPPILELRADRAFFNPDTGRVSATGKEPPVLEHRGEKKSSPDSPVRTLASRFEIDQPSGEVFAFGEVRTFLPDEEGSSIITSGRMAADPQTGWVEYSDQPKIVQRGNSVVGQRVRYNPGGEELIVEREVRSIVLHKNNDTEGTYEVQAQKLIYRRPEHRARYEGEVVMKTQDLLVRAPFLELFFDPGASAQVDRAVAWGGVQIADRNRTAQGQRAVHYPVQQKIILTGEPARVTEATQATATGRQLTFFIGEEKLLIEDSPASERP